MVAFKARRLVWLAMSLMSWTTSPIFCDGRVPLPKGLIIVRFEVFGRLQRGLDAGRLDRFQNSLGDCAVDLHRADIQA